MREVTWWILWAVKDLPYGDAGQASWPLASPSPQDLEFYFFFFSTLIKVYDILNPSKGFLSVLSDLATSSVNCGP